MKAFWQLTALVTPLLLASCAATDQASQTRNTLAQVPNIQQRELCCQSLATLPFQALPDDDDVTLTFDQNSPLFRFEEGVSPFIAYQLPDVGENITIKLEAPIKDTLWQPRVLILNQQFQVVRKFGSKAFSQHKASILGGPEVAGKITVHRERASDLREERYMVVYSPANQFGQTVTIEHPDKRFARSHALVIPPIADPKIPRSPYGQLKMSYNAGILAKLSQSSEMTPIAPAAPSNMTRMPVSQPQQTEPVAPRVQPTPATPMAQPAPSASAPAPSMNPVIEQHYNRLIEEAVAAGQLQQAVNLTAEAQRAGSTSAAEALAAALKQQ